MKRNCIDQECNKRFVISKEERREMKEQAPISGDENLCHSCFREVCQIAYEQSYFGSIAEWGGV
jgi:hypothetical protein